MAIKIQTNKKNNFNQEVLFIEGIKVKFDNQGIGLAKDKKTADKLIENSDFLFYEGKVPEVKTKIVIPTLDNKDSTIEELSRKLHVAYQRVDSLKADKNLLEDNLKDWKEEVRKLTEENKSLKKIVVPDLPKLSVDITKEEKKETDKVTATTDQNVNKDDINPPEGHDEELSLEEKKEYLNKITVPELKDMCNKAKLDRGEWELLKKPALIVYMLKNLIKKE